MLDAADRAAMLDPDLPSYALATRADSSTFGGSWANPYGEAFGMVSGSQPAFYCDQDAGVVRGQPLTIGGVSYAVVGVEPGRAGFVRLRLEAQ